MRDYSLPADKPEAQEAFLADCENLKRNKGDNDVICFMAICAQPLEKVKISGI